MSDSLTTAELTGFYSLHVLNFACNDSKSVSVSHNLLYTAYFTYNFISLCQRFLVSFSLNPDKASSGILTDLKEHTETTNKPN